MNTTKNKSLLTGVMLTSGSLIGAGMFSLPIVSSGMWFVYSLLCFLFIWLINYLAALYILEVNLHFAQGSSFDTLVSKTLGKTWNVISGISIAFLFYILLYAYFSAFGSILSNFLSIELFEGNRWFQSTLSIFFGGILALIVWFSSKLVGRITTLLIFAMILTFIVSMSGLTLHIETVKLFNITELNPSYTPYMWAALPYIMTAFGFSTIVPSLYKYYGRNPVIIKKSIFYGSLIGLIIYCFFIFIVFGNISRESFIFINESGGNIAHIISALENNKIGKTINISLNIFSTFAIITSFLGVGLGLFDYIADKFSFNDKPKNRFYTACLTFIPPGLASFFLPNGFILAIGFAGLFFIFGLVFIPFLMVRKIRRKNMEDIYRVWGGNLLLTIFLITSLIVAVFHILAMLNYLPTW